MTWSTSHNNLLIQTGVPRLVSPKYMKSSLRVETLLNILMRRATSVPTCLTLSSSLISLCVPNEKTIRIFSSGTPRRFISSMRIGINKWLFATRVGSLQIKATVSPGLINSESAGEPIGWRIASSTQLLISFRGGNSFIRIILMRSFSSNSNAFFPWP